MFYVYEWYIVDTKEVIYVGKGCRNRYKVRKHNKFFNDMIKRYNCTSRIVKEFEDEKDAFEYEFTYINELRAKNQCVCNINNGGTGGTISWWTDELRQHYSEYNVMKSKNQRERMRVNNPMSSPIIAEKTNGQKRRKVVIGDITYKSIKDAKEALGENKKFLWRWAKEGKTTDGRVCTIEPQKQYWHKHNIDIHGNQQPSQANFDNSNLEGSTTNG